VNYQNDDNDKVTLTPLPEWARWLLLAALAAGALVILLKVLRRGGAGVILAAAAPAVAMSAMRSPTPATETIDTTDLQAHLSNIAAHDPLIPPVRLFEALRDHGVQLTSEWNMARELRKLGLRSEVRTVPGRTERRWYDLTEYASHE
jgi:hypothetical protein